MDDDRDPRPAPDVHGAWQGRGRGGRPRRRPAGGGGRGLRLPRPQRRGQDDDAAHARDPAHARRSGRRPSPAPTWPATRRQVRRRIGYVPQGGSTDPAETGRGELVIQGRLYGMDAATAKRRAAEVLAALDLEEAADRYDPDLLGRHEAPARRRAGHRPPTGRPVPRRAHDRPRPAGPGAHVGRDPRPARAGHDGLPDDPLPRGGRRAGRPAGHHRPRSDRRRGHGRRAQAPGRRRRHHDRRRGRRGARARGGPQPVVRARGERRGRPRPAVRRPRRRRRAAAHPGPRRRRAAGPDPDPRPAEPRRRLPAPDRPLARERRRHDHVDRRPDDLDPTHHHPRSPVRADHPRHLADLPPLAHPDPAPAGVGRDGHLPADPVPRPVRRRSSKGRPRAAGAGRQRLQLVRPGPARPDRDVRGRVRRLRAGRRAALRRRGADAGDAR